MASRGFIQKEQKNKGASGIEYGVLIAAVSLLAISSVVGFGNKVSDTFDEASVSVRNDGVTWESDAPEGKHFFSYFPDDLNLAEQSEENCLVDTMGDDEFFSRGNGEHQGTMLPYNCVSFVNGGNDRLHWPESSDDLPLQVLATPTGMGQLDIYGGPSADYFEIHSGGNLYMTFLHDVGLNDRVQLVVPNDPDVLNSYPIYAPPNDDRKSQMTFFLSRLEITEDGNYEGGSMVLIAGDMEEISINESKIQIADLEQRRIDEEIQNWTPEANHIINGGSASNTFDVRGHTSPVTNMILRGYEGSNDYVWDGVDTVLVQLTRYDLGKNGDDRLIVSEKSLADIVDIKTNSNHSYLNIYFDSGAIALQNLDTGRLNEIILSGESFSVDELLSYYEESAP